MEYKEVIMKKSLGARLHSIRTKKCMTHTALAEAVGVSTRTIANYEANRTKPDRDRLYALAAALDVPVSSIVGREPRVDAAPSPVSAQAAHPAFVLAPEPAPEQPAETLYEIVNRLCAGRKCEDCPVGNGRQERDRLCAILARGVDIEATIAEIRQWAVENPPAHKPTYRDDFFEKFPDAPQREDGAPLLPIEYVYRPIADSRQAEFKRLTHSQRWDKPFGYWSECAG
jgi:transcriptional regulator with XRE-family HTH domain